jgi:hypothetical protein
MNEPFTASYNKLENIRFPKGFVAPSGCLTSINYYFVR